VKKRSIIIYTAVLIICITASFTIGRLTACTDKSEPEWTEVFYAQIVEKRDSFFLVEGLAVNDINGRGAYTFTVNENTSLIWRGTEITTDDLDVGDNIAITYTGVVLDTYPAGLTQVLRVKLLDDEK